MTFLDTLNVVVASASLVAALISLGVAKRLAHGGASAPLVIQELYSLVSYFDSHSIEQDDPYKRFDELRDSVEQIYKRKFILLLVGFGKQVNEIEKRLKSYKEQRKKIERNVDAASEADKQEFLNRLAAVDESVLDLLKAIESKLEKTIKNPFLHITNLSR